jgi:hypothetical protein
MISIDSMRLTLERLLDAKMFMAINIPSVDYQICILRFAHFRSKGAACVRGHCSGYLRLDEQVAFI